MFDSLRQRLVLSHILPILVIVPIMGLALIYVLETRVVLVNLARQLRGQSVLVAALVEEHPEVWSNRARASDFVDEVNPLFSAELLLLDTEGDLIASSSDTTRGAGQPMLDAAARERIAETGESVEIVYSPFLTEESIEVIVPVENDRGQLIGLVRMDDEVGQVYERASRLRTLTAAILAIALVFGLALGTWLAVTIERPVKQVTHAISSLARGQHLTPLEEVGPTETRLLVQAFNGLVARLRSLEDTRQHLLANLVHELGQPLGSLRAAIHALKGRVGADEAVRQELLTGMEGTIQRLGRLLDDLATLRQQLLGVPALARRPTDLVEWLPGVAQPWGEAAQQKGVAWERALPASLPPVDIDRDRIAQALSNLLSNAVKYCNPGDEITVTAGVGDECGELWIRISDTGPGIPAAEQARIFDPFVRGASHREFPHGMGLGLSIARDIATAHGGRLELHSTPGEGSTFTLCLPLNSDPVS